MYSDASREMISVVDKYFSLNRTLLLSVGLWPYQKSKLARLHSFCCISIIVTLIIFQFTTFITTKCTTDHIIKIFALSSGISAFVIKYNSFCVNSNTIKYLMEQLQCIYDDLMDKNEITIIDRYADIAKRYTITLTICLCCSISAVTVAQLWPDFDIILSANKSRSYRLQVSTEYFIDQEKYYYLLLLHINLALYMGLTVLLATGLMLLAFLYHACGMFEIASYRISNAIDIYISSIKLKNKSLVCKGLIYGVHIHRKAMMFSDYLISRFEISFMFLIVVSVINLSLNTFRLFQMLSLSTYNIEEFLITLISTGICFIYMFLTNFIGQEITDHYDLIFATAYKVQWYITPLYIQNFILFLLLRGNKSFGLNVGGLFVGSLPCFASLANASLSFFIVMYSV
ncbi:uncharacterized protein LOC143901202 isoform X2 [Temnothorax americanus]|uniref:uncharacterized protein LOC143901202 isoform X2 n=1 Tax=Temnothorax americanus TaxID=1964332 RepID=UPI004068C603